MKKTIFILLIINILCQSCIRNIDLDLNFEPKLVVYGIISPNSNPEIFLYESVPLEIQNQSNNVKFVQTAKVFISDGEKTSELFGKAYYTKNFFNGLYNPEKDYDSSLVYSYKGEFNFLPGKTYILEITYNGKTIKASTTIPNKVQLNSSTLQREEKIGENGQPYFEDKIILNFDDPKSIANYYKYSISYNQTVIVDKQIGIDTITGLPINIKDTNILQFRYLDRKYVPDKVLEGEDTYDFDGQNHEFEFLISNRINLFNNPDYIFYVKTSLRNYNKSIYDYKKTSDSQSDEVGLSDPFTEPILIKSNVEGGLGIFSSFCDSDPIIVVYDP